MYVFSIYTRTNLTIKYCHLKWYDLTLYHIILTFNYPVRKAFENFMGKGENAGNQHFLHFPPCFLTKSETEIIVLTTFNLLSSNAFNFKKAKILSFGKEFNN